MKIRTRLLLFLLPTLVGSIALFSTLLAYTWHREIAGSYKMQLESALMTVAALAEPADLVSELSSDFSIYAIPLHSPVVESLSPRIHITPIYKTPDGQKKLMTGYAPLLNSENQLVSWVAADMNVDLIDHKFKESLLIIVLSAAFTILIMTGALYLIAGKISDPVQKLNNSALAIAAGQYNESIQVNGPKEIAELANTLNTMGECLNENINRLKENSLLRERMYGEYECAMLLQHLMLQKNIDDCRSDAVAVKSITFFSDHPRGLLLDFPKTDRSDLFQIHMAEAMEEGLEGTYQLLTQYKYSKESQSHTSVILDRGQSILHSKGGQAPLVWSLDERRFIDWSGSQARVESGDFFFLFNLGLSHLYKNDQKILDLLAKVLKVFAQDGLETTASMLHKELAFATKRKELEEDIHLLCFQILG